MTFCRLLLFVALSSASLTGRAAPEVAAVVVGDLHSDIDALVSIARSTKLISSKYEWTGGKKKLIIAGDFVGKNHRSRSMIEVLMHIEARAAQAGGELVALLGNWELDLLKLRYDRFSERDLSRFAVSPFGIDTDLEWAKVNSLVRWLQNRPAIWSNHELMISHAGPTADLLTRTPLQINNEVQRALTTGSEHPLLDQARGPISTNTRPSKKLLDQLTEKYGWTRFVMGHEPTDSKHIELEHSILGDRLVRIDSSISRSSAEIGSTEALLVYEDGTLAVHESKTIDKASKPLRKIAAQTACLSQISSLFKN